MAEAGVVRLADPDVEARLARLDDLLEGLQSTPGPYEDAVQGQPIFEENGPDDFMGVDIMRTVRSFDPCLPCGVHMYVGKGKTLTTMHSPTYGANHG